MAIEKDIPDKPFTTEDFLVALNREIVPVVRQIRRFLNRRFGVTTQPNLTGVDQYVFSQLDEVVLVDASDGAKSVVLPPPSKFFARRAVVTKIDTAVTTVTVFTGGAGATINNAASAVIPSFPGSLTFLSDGNLAWYIVAKVP